MEAMPARGDQQGVKLRYSGSRAVKHDESHVRTYVGSCCKLFHFFHGRAYKKLKGTPTMEQLGRPPQVLTQSMLGIKSRLSFP